MLKSLRAPERLFQLATWLVTFVFAGFLVGLGGKLVGELPGVEQGVEQVRFVDADALSSIQRASDSLRVVEGRISAERDRAELVLTAAANAYQAKREAFDNWIATRTATTDATQDPEVVRRTRELDALSESRRSAQAALEMIDSRRLELSQVFEEREMERQALYEAASGPYERAVFLLELRIFGIRLLLTLPLLGFGIWLFTKKRTSQYWPLARGFILFALFTFFFELVPYLPTYGGYVRYVVGVVLTAVTGHYLIRAMQRYVAKRAVAAQKTENERRESLGYEEAMKKMQANLCPGCERPIVGGAEGKTNFCVHCGMTLFNECGACGSRRNAFFQYCPTCGATATTAVSTQSVAPAAPAATS